MNARSTAWLKASGEPPCAKAMRLMMEARKGLPAPCLVCEPVSSLSKMASTFVTALLPLPSKASSPAKHIDKSSRRPEEMNSL